MQKLALAILATLFALPAFAELSNLYPRTRMFSEIGRPTEKDDPNSSSRRRTISRTDRVIEFKDEDHYDTNKLRAGAFINFSSDFLFRDFLITDSGSVGAMSAYASFYGVEAAVLAVNDFGDELETDQPLLMAYRLSYTFKYDTSINTVAFTHQDWSNSAAKIGSKGQGFGESPPIFEEESNEVALSSYWFTERLQPNQMNYFLGFDAQVWIEEPGFRTAVTGGVFAHKTADTFLPNGARIQGSVILQSNYHTDGASIPGFNGYVEAYWDLRYSTDTTLPLIVSLFVDYYLPFDEDPLDKVIFGGRLEFAF
ncbi:MAG: hypothetical protein KDB07_13085 [Planctomycetes bacterium]|nr:hypothetical protein [Planctomycetota bacterium]